MLNRLTRVAIVVGVFIIALGVMLLGYRVIRADLTAAVYRQRLTDLARDYESLGDRYNTAVRRTAVTELMVDKGAISVVIRTAEGDMQTIPTSLDASREVYVDYVVLDGRLWIRRLFDSKTPPEQGTLIDPALASLDWSDKRLAQGQAVYRSLTDGRWVVTVSGDGALGLARSESGEPMPLASRPPVHSFDEITAQADASARGITLADVWDAIRP